jgi:hypothetical protein
VGSPVIGLMFRDKKICSSLKWIYTACDWLICYDHMLKVFSPKGKDNYFI